jgi:cell division protein FtsB
MISKFRKKKKRENSKYILFSIFLGLFLLFIFVFLVISNIRIWERRQLILSKINDTKKEIRILEEKNKNIKEKIFKANSSEYLEEIAREQFNLKAPGEDVVVISGDIKGNNHQKSQLNDSEEAKNFWNFKNWFRFLDIFFK